MMSEEGFEEWDADFLDQLIQVEELALSSSTQNPNPNPTTAAFSHFPQQPPDSFANSHNHLINYSPPRELSQRTSDFNNTLLRSSNDKELEIQHLKRELGRALKQLTELEHECFELRKERNRKKEKIKFVYSHNEENNAGVHCLKSTNMESGAHTADHHVVSQQFQNAKALEDHVGSRIDVATSSCKAIGVQTDIVDDFTNLTKNDGLPTHLDLSEKLKHIWGSPSDQKLGRNLISKLFMTCPTDFHVLFGCMSMNMSPKIQMDSLEDENSSDVALQHHIRSFDTSEAAKVSHLYSVLTKIGNGMLQLGALFEPLLVLCSLENVVIVHRSLSILRVFLKHLLRLEKKFEGSALYSGTMS